MSFITENILTLKNQIPGSVRLVAVSKTKSADEIMEAYSTGHRTFGENRVMEILSKKDTLPEDIEWHFIGHLQTNKVKLLIPFISIIESVDSFRLLKVINSEAFKIGRTVKCLLQFYIACEETKSGFLIEEALEMLKSEDYRQLKNTEVCGVMGMATFTDDTLRVRNEFRMLRNHFTELKNNFFAHQDSFREISMGMSGDYWIAVEEGSTMVRIGNVIFGDRNR